MRVMPEYVEYLWEQMEQFASDKELVQDEITSCCDEVTGFLMEL